MIAFAVLLSGLVCVVTSAITPGFSDNEPPNVDKHKNVNLLPKICGYIDTEEKIFKGNKTGILEYPWMTLLSYQTSHGPAFLCGGTIINNHYILTAAHCIRTRNKLLSVRIGEHNIDTPIDCGVVNHKKYCAPPYQDLKILETIIHPYYNHPKHAHDIGLIRVPKIDFSIENTKPICLPLENTRTYSLTKHPTVIVTGWGATENRVPSKELLQASLSAVDLEKCRKAYKNSPDIVIGPRQICAVDSISDSCSGDSGGPLQAASLFHDDARMVQYGVVSFGSTFCNDSSYPGIYTRVASYMDWILDSIKP